MNDYKKPTWYILGAGAMGSLWASYYRLAGFSVVLIVKKPHSQTLLTLKNGVGSHQLSVSYKTIEQLNEGIQYLLVSTKAQQTESAISRIKPHLDKHASVLVMQNGLAAQQLPHQLPTQKLFAAVTTEGAYRSDFNTVVHAGVGRTLIGSVDASLDVTNSEYLIQRLPQEFLTIESCKNINQQQWKKLALNCVINGLTAIHRCRNGELLTIDEAHQQMKILCEETFHIIDSLDIVIACSARSLYEDVRSVCTVTAENFSSMHQDISHNRTTEIDFINGFLCEQADKIAVDCRENRNIVKKIKQLEMTR